MNNRGLWFVLGVSAGAVGGLLLAPQTGRRTRAAVRDKATKYTHEATEFAQKKSKHIRNKAHGYAHEISKVFSGVGGREQMMASFEEEEPSAST